MKDRRAMERKLYDKNGIPLTPDETRAILWYRAMKRLARGPEIIQRLQSMVDNAKRLQKAKRKME